MSTPIPQGRTSCAAQSAVNSVAAPLTIRESGNSHALPSTSGLDSADPAPRAGDAPSHRHGRTLPSNLQALRDLTSSPDAPYCDLTQRFVRSCANPDRRA